MKKRLGEILLERGVIDVDQLNSALAHHRQWGKRLGVALVEKGMVAEGTITRVLSEVMQIPMVDLAKVIIEPQAIATLKAAMCDKFDVFPIAVKSVNGRNNLLLAMVDPLNVAAVDEVSFLTNMTVRPAIAQISSLRAAIDRYYHKQNKEIPPLSFEKVKQQAAPGEPESGSEMTIIRGGEVRVVDSTGEVSVRDLTGHQPPPQPAPSPNQEVPTGPPVYAPPPGFDPYGNPTAPGHGPAQSHYPQAAFQNQPTGAYMMAMPQTSPGFAVPPNTAVQEAVAQERAVVDGQMESLEKNFWALMRVLAKKGLITKEEFLAELNAAE